MLTPGVYNAMIQGLEPVLRGNKFHLRMQMAAYSLIASGTVMMEMRMHDGMVDYYRHGWPYKTRALCRSLRNRHHKAKPQPNAGPRSKKRW